MRKNPEFKDVMPILDQPSCLALINMITCFRKFNYEHSDQHINEIVSLDNNGELPREAGNELMLSNEATVLLMQHIVRELNHVYKEY